MPEGDAKAIVSNTRPFYDGPADKIYRTILGSQSPFGCSVR